MGAKPAGLDEEDTAVFHEDEAAKTSAVGFRGRLWQTGQGIDTSVGAALAVLEGKRAFILNEPLPGAPRHVCLGKVSRENIRRRDCVGSIFSHT